MLFAQDVTYSYSLSGAITWSIFQGTTPAGGFPAGSTLKSMTLVLSNFTTTGTGLVQDLAVAVAPSTPTQTNATFSTNNTGAGATTWFTAGTVQNWLSGPNGFPVLGTNTMTVASTVALSGLQLYVGNAYTDNNANWTGTLTVVYNDGVTPSAVPTLSEWAQLMLGLMVLSMLGWQWRKQQN